MITKQNEASAKNLSNDLENKKGLLKGNGVCPIIWGRNENNMGK